MAGPRTVYYLLPGGPGDVEWPGLGNCSGNVTAVVSRRTPASFVKTVGQMIRPAPAPPARSSHPITSQGGPDGISTGYLDQLYSTPRIAMNQSRHRSTCPCRRKHGARGCVTEKPQESKSAVTFRMGPPVRCGDAFVVAGCRLGLVLLISPRNPALRATPHRGLAGPGRSDRETTSGRWRRQTCHARHTQDEVKAGGTDGPGRLPVGWTHANASVAPW